VLAGRLEGMKRLDTHLLDLAELRVDVEPWEQADTEDFVKTSLAQAGQPAGLFAAPAVARLHELSHGIPRRAAQLADLALLAGTGQNLQQIDAGVVEAVYQELATVATV
jgi:type II secretory pathway predicted ATPase ExeA